MCQAVSYGVVCHMRIQNHLPFDQTVGLATEGSLASDATGLHYPASWVTLGTAGNPSNVEEGLPPGVPLSGSISFNRMDAAPGDVISRVRIGVEADSVHLLEFPNVPVGAAEP